MTLPISGVQPPCAGQWDLFDSTNIDAHRVARTLCASCPFLDDCADELEATRRDAYTRYGPRGTWAGRLVGVAKAEDRARMKRENAAYTDEEAHAAFNAYRRGERGAWVETGRMVYERQRASKRRHRGAA